MRRRASMRTGVLMIFACTAALLCSAPREAGAIMGCRPRARTIPELAGASETIVTGAVVQVKEYSESQQALIKVTKVVSGYTGGSITVISSLRDPGEPRFREGENVLLFLAPSKEKGTYACVYGAAGKFVYLPEEERRVVQLAEEYARFVRDGQDTGVMQKHYSSLPYYIEKPLSDRRLLAAILRELEEAEESTETGSIVKGVVDDDLLLSWLRDDGMATQVQSWSALRLARRGVERAADDIALRVSPKYPHSLRVHAIAALRALGSSKQAGPLVEALNDEEADIRGAAAYALGSLQDSNQTVVGALVKRFEVETDIFVKLEIVSSIGNLPGYEARKALEGMGGATVGECIVRLVEEGNEDSNK